MTLQEMKNVDVRTVDPDTLVDIDDVVVDPSLPRDERIQSFLTQIKNPYCFKCAGMVVKISHTDTDVTLEERMAHYLRTRY